MGNAKHITAPGGEGGGGWTVGAGLGGLELAQDRRVRLGGVLVHRPHGDGHRLEHVGLQLGRGLLARSVDGQRRPGFQLPGPKTAVKVHYAPVARIQSAIERRLTTENARVLNRPGRARTVVHCAAWVAAAVAIAAPSHARCSHFPAGRSTLYG